MTDYEKYLHELDDEKCEEITFLADGEECKLVSFHFEDSVGFDVYASDGNGGFLMASFGVDLCDGAKVTEFIERNLRIDK